MAFNLPIAALTVVIIIFGPVAEGRTCSVKVFVHTFPHTFTVGNVLHTEDCDFSATMCEGSCDAHFKYSIHKDTTVYNANRYCDYDVDCCRAKPGEFWFENISINPTEDCRGRGGGPTSLAPFLKTNQRVVGKCECDECLAGSGPPPIGTTGTDRCEQHSP